MSIVRCLRFPNAFFADAILPPSLPTYYCTQCVCVNVHSVAGPAYLQTNLVLTGGVIDALNDAAFNVMNQLNMKRDAS